MIDSSRIQFDNDIRSSHNVTLIAGSDEVGRGAMAGPIVVASVILERDYVNPAINDSKKLTAKQREALYDEILHHCVAFAIKEYDNTFVDTNNPKQTSAIGMRETLLALTPPPDICLLDGETLLDFPYRTVTLIKGDTLSQTIGAASIIAKVYRDRLMDQWGQKYPQYGFSHHKGYCTKTHQAAAQKYGVLPIHRKSYKPIKKLLEEK